MFAWPPRRWRAVGQGFRWSPGDVARNVAAGSRDSRRSQGNSPGIASISIVRLEVNYRRRGETRLEAFSDGVFAITIACS
jgi:hypothetical protein